MENLRQGKKIKFEAVFLPSSYRRRGPVYNKASTGSNIVDVSGGIFDSQQSVSDVFSNFSPTRTPTSIAEGEPRSPSPLVALAEGDMTDPISPAIALTQKSTQLTQTSTPADPTDPSPDVSFSPEESNAASTPVSSASADPYGPLKRTISSLQSAVASLRECGDRLADTTSDLLRVNQYHDTPKPNTPTLL